MAFSPSPCLSFSFEYQHPMSNKQNFSYEYKSRSKIGLVGTMTFPKGPVTQMLPLEFQAKNDPSVIAAELRSLCKKGQLKAAVGILHSMDQQCIQVDLDTYAYLLEVCVNTKSLAEGEQVHAHMLMNNINPNLCLKSKLVSMYVVCGNLLDARLIFENIRKPNVFSWNTMITGYARNGYSEEALALYYQMQLAAVRADRRTFPSVLKACASLSALRQGKEFHVHVIKSGCLSDVFVGNALIDMYAKCGTIENARRMFDKMSERDVVSWTAMIVGYVQNGLANEALKHFCQMHSADVKPNSFTIVCVLQACAILAAPQEGREIHSYIVRSGTGPDVFVDSALIDMYSKCGNIEFACHVFDKMPKRDVVSWNTMITGCILNGHASESLKFFIQMQQVGVKPNVITISSILSASAHLESLQYGSEVHGYIIRSGFESDVYVGCALIDMYAKCKSIDVARRIFDKLSQRHVTLWNAMIVGYAHSGHANEALKLFREMQLAEIKLNPVTILSIIPACVHFSALQLGKEIHGCIIRNGFGSDISVVNALIDMYAKCRSLDIACHVFENISERDVVSWNTIIAGYGVHGQGKDALTLFNQMQLLGIKPNHITFISVLSACSHAGLVDEGWKYFNYMSKNHGITPKVEHYACMVDLLGRAGCLHEAYDFIKKMPLMPDGVVWGALLGACRIHCNIDLGERVVECLLELEPENSGYYVLMSNIYAAAGRWQDVAKIRKTMKDRGLTKNPGYSWIEVKNKVHTFLVGDRSHPQSEKIYAMLDVLVRKMKEAGYAPDTNFALHDVEEEKKEHILCHHSEKLAIAFGLINTIPGTSIRITKNLRVCNDCHTATKFISKIVERDIVVRDASRFHHFKNGMCTCGDYW